MWTSPPAGKPFKANITNEKIAHYAAIAGQVVLETGARGGGGRTDIRLIDAGSLASRGAAARMPQFKLSDGLHWSTGRCAANSTTKSNCMLFKASAGLESGLYSCLWDATQAFLCHA